MAEESKVPLPPVPFYWFPSPPPQFLFKLYEIATILRNPLIIGWCSFCHSMICSTPQHRCKSANRCNSMKKTHQCKRFHTAEELLISFNHTPKMIKGTQPCLYTFELNQKCIKENCLYAHNLSEAVCSICLGNHFRLHCIYDTVHNTLPCRKLLKYGRCLNKFCLSAHYFSEAICSICRGNHFMIHCKENSTTPARCTCCNPKVENPSIYTPSLPLPSSHLTSHGHPQQTIQTPPPP